MWFFLHKLRYPPIPLIRIGGIVAACGLQVNLEFGPFLRCLDLSAAIVRVLDDGNIALDHIFAYAYPTAVYFGEGAAKSI